VAIDPKYLPEDPKVLQPELFTQSDRRSGRCRALDVSSMMLQAIS